MKIVFLGSIEFSKVVLEKLNEKYEVVCVVSQPNRVKKKGVFLDTPTAKFAKDNNILIHQPEHIKESVEFLKGLNADVLVSAAYGQYVPSKVLNLFKKTINVHGSLLPKYRGGAPIQRSIMAGDTVTGITLIRMEKALDGGVMYAKRELEIDPNEDADSLFNRLAYLGADLLLENIEDIYNEKNLGEVQDESLATYAPNIEKEEELIDFNNTSKDIINKIRGLSTNPGAYFAYKDTVIKVFKASEVTEINGKVGEILKTKGGIVIKTLDSAISLDMVLPAGKKLMDGKSFANGQKLFVVGESI